MRIGSEAHKELFCSTFIEGHRPFEPQGLPWPELDDATLATLRGIPFWSYALKAEEDAGPMVSATAAVATDPLIHEALALQGYEESRHARILQHMIELYGLEAEKLHIDEPTVDVEADYIDFGFEECLDSFGAFGIFALARRSGLFHDELFTIFDQVMNEEAHHIVFFINWFAHRQVNLGVAAEILRGPKSLWHYGKAINKLVDMVRDGDTEGGEDFLVTGAANFVDALTPELVLSTCLSENARRMSRFDSRLLRPRLGPNLARLGLSALKMWPGRKDAAASSLRAAPTAAAEGMRHTATRDHAGCAPPVLDNDPASSRARAVRAGDRLA
jgi:hypothetical protein